MSKAKKQDNILIIPKKTHILVLLNEDLGIKLPGDLRLFTGRNLFHKLLFFKNLQPLLFYKDKTEILI